MKSDPALPKTAHGLRSSNLSFYSLVWSIAKTCRSVIGLEKKFFKLHAKSDIVSEDGLSWIMVSSVTEQKIIWDLAKAGWVDSSGESEDDFADQEDDKPEGLLRQVEALVKASRMTVVHCRHPKITLILPRINAVPEHKEVAAILQKVRNMGVIVLTSKEVPTSLLSPADAIRQMAADRSNSFSETLNIDCTSLLAFASDLSHGRVEHAHWHNCAIAKQIELEAEDLLLPSSLWPACSSRKLVTTRESADRMREIIKTIGTEDERKRASLLLGLDENSGLPQDQIIQRFQALTDYPVPPEWSLPIKIADTDMAAIMSKLPPFAEKVAEKLTPINQSVFLYGWANGMTTLSSNASVAKLFDHAVEQSNDENSVGPDIWLSPSCRSLVGKEKKRRGYTEKEGCVEKEVVRKDVVAES